MKKMLIAALALSFCFAGSAFAMKGMDHGSEHGEMKMEHDGHGMKKMDHDAMMKEGGMIMLESDTVDGVTAKAHLKDVREAMKAAGMEATHHLMVNFEKQDGTSMDQGNAALKMTTPADVEQEPVMMMGMEGGFGVDINLKQPGVYHFKVGTKLNDQKKRTFHFHYALD